MKNGGFFVHFIFLSNTCCIKSKTMSFKSIYQPIQFLSIDVLAGSAAVMIFAVRLLQVNPNPAWWIVLPCAVWSFYTVDHLIDGYKSQGGTRIARHRFHYQHRYILIILTAITTLSSLTLSMVYLNTTIIYAGFIVGLIVLAYFLLLALVKKQQSVFLQKEFIIALVYVGGIWLAPLIWSGHFPERTIVCILVVFFLLAWAEGIMASYFDVENDLREKHTSFTICFGATQARRFLILLHILIFLLLLLAIGYSQSGLQTNSLVILLFMNICLMSIILFPGFFQQKERFRILGESVFLFPALIVFF